MCANIPKKKKQVWIWTENKQVMTTAVERGWNTFVFPKNRQDIANEWSCKLIFYCSYFLCDDLSLVSKICVANFMNRLMRLKGYDVLMVHANCN